MSSLAAFIAAAFRPPTPLAKAIVLVLVVKLIAIAGIKLVMFSDNAQPTVDAAAVAQALSPTSVEAKRRAWP